MKTAALHNLGCKVNAYETEAMRQMLEEAGYRIVPFSGPADLYIINTCTVTNTADKKSRQMIHRARKWNPDAIVIAAGCYVQASPERAAADEAVDLVIGNGEKQNLPAILRELTSRDPSPDAEGEDGSKIRVSDINVPGHPYEKLSVDHPANRARAFVKVQDGCNRFCSYCIIPYARGRSRSRSPEDVLREVGELAQNGYPEIVLTGIHLSSYGIDIGTSLPDLIRRVHEVDGIRRIRLGSLEPGIITEEFVREMSALPNVCPHFHLSLQSGSDAVLERMNRQYTAQEYLEKCAVLRTYYEHPAITTDVIVGFPGETEEEFAETCAFVKRAALSGIHVFPYSLREGTAAARMEGQIPERIRAKRGSVLAQIASDLRGEFERWYEGRRVEVLFEEAVQSGGERYCVGFTAEYVKVWYKTEESLQNRIRTVEFSMRHVGPGE